MKRAGDEEGGAMSPKKKLPTEGELEILRVLWSRGPSTVREVHQELSRERATGYTTVLKLMQIMTDKGTIERDATVRPQIFRPAQPMAHMQKRMVREMVDKVFGGSPGSLVLQALNTKKATKEERRRIRELLDRLEGDAP
jgi:predicted transcriptional regulator